MKTVLMLGAFFVLLALTEASPWSYYKNRKSYYMNFKCFILILIIKNDFTDFLFLYILLPSNLFFKGRSRNEDSTHDGNFIVFIKTFQWLFHTPSRCDIATWAAPSGSALVSFSLSFCCPTQSNKKALDCFSFYIIFKLSILWVGLKANVPAFSARRLRLHNSVSYCL